MSVPPNPADFPPPPKDSKADPGPKAPESTYTEAGRLLAYGVHAAEPVLVWVHDQSGALVADIEKHAACLAQS